MSVFAGYIVLLVCTNFVGIALLSWVQLNYLHLQPESWLSGLPTTLGIAGALILGQGLIMNIYYQTKQGLDIISFWKEIGKMSVVPLFIIIVSLFIISFISLNTWLSLGVAIILFSAIYLPLFILFSMNNYERNLFIAPLINRLRK